MVRKLVGEAVDNGAGKVKGAKTADRLAKFLYQDRQGASNDHPSYPTAFNGKGNVLAKRIPGS